MEALPQPPALQPDLTYEYPDRGHPCPRTSQDLPISISRAFCFPYIQFHIGNDGATATRICRRGQGCPRSRERHSLLLRHYHLFGVNRYFELTCRRCAAFSFDHPGHATFYPAMSGDRTITEKRNFCPTSVHDPPDTGPRASLPSNFAQPASFRIKGLSFPCIQFHIGNDGAKASRICRRGQGCPRSRERHSLLLRQ